jgi:hypothetical protein
MESLRKVTPRRFVYHVTRRLRRESIAKHGLIARERDYLGGKTVFAHNSNQLDRDWYPYCFDVFYFTPDGTSKVQSQIINDDRCVVTNFVYLLEFDVWRIDTHKLKRDWFIDNHACFDFLQKINIPFYVFSYGDVPVSALKLIDLEKPIDIFYKESEGVAHVINHFR